jgi:hypothetical protein
MLSLSASHAEIALHVVMTATVLHAATTAEATELHVVMTAEVTDSHAVSVQQMLR